MFCLQQVSADSLRFSEMCVPFFLDPSRAVLTSCLVQRFLQPEAGGGHFLHVDFIKLFVLSHRKPVSPVPVLKNYHCRRRHYYHHHHHHRRRRHHQRIPIIIVVIITSPLSSPTLSPPTHPYHHFHHCCRCHPLLRCHRCHHYHHITIIIIDIVCIIIAIIVINDCRSLRNYHHQ